MRRRDFLKLGAALPLAGRAASIAARKAKVVVIGGGYGGATAAGELARRLPGAQVTLVEGDAVFVSCPLSNLVLGGSRAMADITRSYTGLEKRGVRRVRDEAVAVDGAKRIVRLARGAPLPYDRLVVAPGIDFLLEEIEGYAGSGDRVLHAWKAGAQTAALRRRLEEMPDGGVYLLSVPMLPYRCPPAPYERACQVAGYFKRTKPRGKVLILDANPDITSEAALFQRAWRDLYGGMIEYRPNSAVIGVEAGAVRTDFETVRGDVLNVVPPQRAGDIAARAGLITHNKRWCEVDWRTMESTAVASVHVLGDSTLSASAMPKSAHIAHAQARLCAAAIGALLEGRAPDDRPRLDSECYSFVSEREAVHLATRYEYDAAHRTMALVRDATRLSTERSVAAAENGRRWARNIWAKMLD